ncbi:hypothetical protein ACWCW7_18690 [Nocardia tengchongensis]
MATVVDSSLLELDAPLATAGTAGRISVRDRVDIDEVAARRFAGLTADLVQIDPIWTGGWSSGTVTKNDERFAVTPDQGGFEELFAAAREARNHVPTSDAVYFSISTPYGASLVANRVHTVPAVSDMPRLADIRSGVSFHINPRPLLREAGLVSRARTGAVGLEFFETVVRWFEPTSFVCGTVQANRIGEEVSKRLDKLLLFRMIDKATASRLSLTKVGWLNLFDAGTPMDTGLLPENAIVSAEPRTGGTIVRLGDSPWAVTDEDYYALRAAVGLPPRPDLVVDTRGMSLEEVKALKRPYW